MSDVDIVIEVRAVLLTRASIIDTATKLKNIIGRDVAANEIAGLVSYMKKQNYKTFKGADPDIVRELLATKFASQLGSFKQGYNVDTKELLKRQIGGAIVSHDGEDSELYNVYNPTDCAPGTGLPRVGFQRVSANSNGGGSGGDNSSMRTYEQLENRRPNVHDVNSRLRAPQINRTVEDVFSAYVLLDSRYRKIEGVTGTPISEYRWEYAPTVITAQGTTNVVSKIQDILYMQVQEFHIPYVPDADNAYGRISMLIDEFSALSIIAHENRRYHYLMQSERDGNRIKLNPPGTDEGKFRFSTPISRVDSLTVSFGSPLTKVTFQPDRFNVTIVSINATETQIIFPMEHGINNREIVIFTGYTTAATLADEPRILIINRNIGHAVTVVNVTTLSIEVDLTTVTSLVTPPLVECFITARRILIPLRLVYAHKPTL